MKLLAFAVVPLVAAPFARADDQAFLALLAETKVMRIAGMKVRPMPKINLPPGMKMPGGVNLGAMMGEPSRVLNIRLWSPSIAPDNATATIAPPAGLQQGDTLNLNLYRPTTTTTEGGTGGPGNTTQPDTQFTIKIYWGSSDTVRPDQPKIITFGTLTPDQKAAMQSHMKETTPNRSGAGASYFYKDGWTTGYWPDQGQQISNDASLVGSYALTTNYTGNVTIDAPSNVDFLAPYQFNAPDFSVKPALDQSLALQWNPIPNALGQYAYAMGMEGKSTLILWSSSEVYSERIMGDMGFLQMSDVRDYVDKTVFLKGDATAVTIPAGIFKDADFAMLNMVGYGPGSALEKGQPLPRIQTKTSVQVMLGGKKMRGGAPRGDDGGK